MGPIVRTCVEIIASAPPVPAGGIQTPLVTAARSVVAGDGNTYEGSVVFAGTVRDTHTAGYSEETGREQLWRAGERVAGHKVSLPDGSAAIVSSRGIVHESHLEDVTVTQIPHTPVW